MEKISNKYINMTQTSNANKTRGLKANSQLDSLKVGLKIQLHLQVTLPNAKDHFL